ncbi:MAG: hypothetical protein AAF235_03855 [Planctomycetota bacterium]
MAGNPEHEQTPQEVQQRAEAFRATFSRLKDEIGKMQSRQQKGQMG